MDFEFDGLLFRGAVLIVKGIVIFKMSAVSEQVQIEEFSPAD